jgi:hypothetical protein
LSKARQLLLGGAIVGACLCTSVAAFADDAARAQTLFDDAKRLMDKKQFDAACPKLAESLQLDPGLGTRLYLASCYEKAGKSASAFAQYTEAVRTGGTDKRVAAARQHIATLEPALSMLTLMGELDEDAVVSLDGKVVEGFAPNKEFPVDPGHHSLVFSAPGKKSRTLDVEIDSGLPASLGLPTLEDDENAVDAHKTPPPPRPVQVTPVEAPPSAHALAAPPPKEDSGSGKRVGGWVTIGLGVVALNVGATFGVITLASASDVKSQCPTGPCSTQQAIDKNDAAHTSALLADILVPAGVALIGLGAILVATSSSTPAPTAAQLRVLPSVGSSSGGLAVMGAF